MLCFQSPTVHSNEQVGRMSIEDTARQTLIRHEELKVNICICLLWATLSLGWHIGPGRGQKDCTGLKHRKIWRRQHRKGPINDSFTDLCLQKDPKTGAIIIVEARQEYLSNGQSEQNRTCYFTKCSFDDKNEDSSTNGVGITPVANLSSISSIRVLSPSRLLPPNDPLVHALDATSKPQADEEALKEREGIRQSKTPCV